MIRRWYASSREITRMGPYPSKARALRALELAPRPATEERPRVVPAPHGGWAVIVEPVRPVVLPGTLADGARVWCETVRGRGAK